MKQHAVPLEQIRIDGGTQPRVEIDETKVSEYADLMGMSVTFPPVTLFYDGAVYWLADGFHRFHAAKRRGLESLGAEIHAGERRDAVLYSVGANAAHGLNRSNADKRKAVMTLLNDDEWKQWSNREIAKRCGVDEGTVRNLRPVTAELPQSKTYTTKHGTTATMQTQNIGRIGQEKWDAIAAAIRDGKSAEAIASTFKTSPSTIARIRRDLGLSVGPDKSSAAVAERRERVREMAANGFSIPQIAAAVGVGEQRVVDIAQEHDIDLTQARVVSKVMRHDSNRILEHMVMDAENLTADVGLIRFIDLDRGRLGAWIESLVQSRRSLDLFIRQLKKEHQSHGEAA